MLPTMDYNRQAGPHRHRCQRSGQLSASHARPPTRMPSDSWDNLSPSATTSQITMTPPWNSRWRDSSPHMPLYPHAPSHPYMPSHTYIPSAPYRYDDHSPVPQGTTFGIQSSGKQTPQFQTSAISDVGSMTIGSMAVNMSVENVMNSDYTRRPPSCRSIVLP